MAEPLTYARANAVQRSLRRLAATRAGAWLFSRILPRIDRPVYRLTGGRHTFASIATGIPIVMLTTTGARSGVPRTVPLLGFPTPDGLVVIASNFGRRRHPAWYHNLRHSPDGEVTIDGAARRFRAVEAQGARRDRVWQEGLKIYPGRAAYERRASHRQIAVFVLETA